MLRRNSPATQSVESVLRPEGSLWRERFVKEVGLELGGKVQSETTGYHMLHCLEGIREKKPIDDSR